MHRYVLVTCRCYVMLMVGLVRRDLRSGSIYSMVGLVASIHAGGICERVVVVMVGPLA